MILAVLAVGLAFGLSRHPVAELPAIGLLVQVLGISGVAALAVALLLGLRWMIAWGSVILLIQYGVSLITSPTIDPWAPAYAAGLFLMTDAAYTSLERRAQLAGPSGFLVQEVGRIVVLTSGAAAASAVVLALVRLPVRQGILVQTAGIGAAAAVLTTLILLVRRRG